MRNRKCLDFLPFFLNSYKTQNSSYPLLQLLVLEGELECLEVVPLHSLVGRDLDADVHQVVQLVRDRGRNPGLHRTAGLTPDHPEGAHRDGGVATGRLYLVVGNLELESGEGAGESYADIYRVDIKPTFLLRPY